MAKLELKSTFSESSENLVLIPGGPGLSPVSFDALAKEIRDSFNVYLFYPTGTYGDTFDKPRSYDVQLDELVSELVGIETFYLIGHSFGGILAVDASLRCAELARGVVCISSPFLSETFKVMGENFNNRKTPEQIELDEILFGSPTNDNYKRWFASYAPLYFTRSKQEDGRQMLLEDSVCVQSYLDAVREASKKESLLEQLKTANLRKMLMGGTDDALLPPSTLATDAQAGGFKFEVIQDAGHFAHFESPKSCASIIKNFIEGGNL